LNELIFHFIAFLHLNLFGGGHSEQKF